MFSLGYRQKVLKNVKTLFSFGFLNSKLYNIYVGERNNLHDINTHNAYTDTMGNVSYATYAPMKVCRVGFCAYKRTTYNVG